MPKKRLVATMGLENMIVVDTSDAVLICPKDCAQDVKKIVEQIKLDRRPEVSIDTKFRKYDRGGTTLYFKKKLIIWLNVLKFYQASL